MSSPDSIFIRNLRVRCRIGVPERERRRAQEVVIDLVAYRDLRRAGRDDDVRETLSYSELKQSVTELVQKGSHRLLESVAEDIASSILKNKGIDKVTVTVRKKKFSEAPAIGVEITRRRHG